MTRLALAVGEVCGKAEGHPGYCRSVESVASAAIRQGQGSSREYQRAYYEANREKIRAYRVANPISPEKSAKRSRAYRARRQDMVNALKVFKGCERCGYNADPAALDMDHIDVSQKLECISQMVTRKGKYSDAQFILEIYKCRVLCSNCHRIKTRDENDRAKGIKRNKENSNA